MPKTAWARGVAFLRAGLLAGFAFLFLFVVGTPLLLHALWTRQIDTLYQVFRWALRWGLRLAGIRLEVKGFEHIPQGRPCVYMSNHQSNLDPPILLVVLPPRIAFMGKRQVFSIPVLGTALHLADFVPVHREVREEARASVAVALEKLQRGVTFLVFPEGTRSWDGRLQRFKYGVFLLAIRAGAPIVPITLDGANRLMPKGKWELYPGVVRVTIHPAVETRQRNVEERRQLAEEVRATIASGLPEEQQGPAPAPLPAEAAVPLDDAL